MSRRILFFTGALVAGAPAFAASPGAAVPPEPHTLLVLGLLFLFCCALGVVAVLGGVGGGVLFVPLVSAFFPFHMDFVRSTGLLVALALSLTALPSMLRQGFASLRLALPFSLASSIFAVVGALLALSMSQDLAKILMGVLILGVSAIMFASKKCEHPEVPAMGAVSGFFGLEGYYRSEKDGLKHWRVRNARWALPIFCFIGLIAGMFGMGAGWANIPVLNLLLGAPLKVSIGTSLMLISLTDTSAAWVYLNGGAVLAAVAVPSMLGIMLGSKVGAWIFPKLRSSSIKLVVLAVLFVSGLLSLAKGFHIV